MNKTYQRLINGDARDLSFLDDESIHLVVTSPPYRNLKRYNKKDFDKWFKQIWNIPGASTRTHPAPFPLELASRLIRMFSFHGDTVLDPFCGTGTTMIAALRYGRNSIGIDIEPEYCHIAARFQKKESSNLFFKTEIFFERMFSDNSGHLQVCEDQALYEVRSARKVMA